MGSWAEGTWLCGRQKGSSQKFGSLSDREIVFQTALKTL